VGLLVIVDSEAKHAKKMQIKVELLAGMGIVDNFREQVEINNTWNSMEN